MNISPPDTILSAEEARTLLEDRFNLDLTEAFQVTATYPCRISSYYLELIDEPGDPVWRQAVPDLRELNDPQGLIDPLDEENLSPVPNLVHKYPDRALFLIASRCPVYCRFCTRKRKVGTDQMVINEATITNGLYYLQQTPAITDVLLSGGDPLLLPPEFLEYILARLRNIRSVETIRIGTRVPCTLPQRVTPGLAAMLGRYHPLFINTHFNHPRELTEAAAQACGLLADAGIPLGCQTVLLRGVNDHAPTLAALFKGLLRLRVRPYYLFQADQTRGTSHFRTTVDHGLAIMRELIGPVTGMAIPTYALDAPGGGGKIPLTPEYITDSGSPLLFNTYQGRPCRYPNTLDDLP
ncbi:MAG: lysine 2,3-aminomutase [Desulfobulbus propionicus]|nr:MAG: lysine 2,3-aminomutase [Desulfobulbus propionicus]